MSRVPLALAHDYLTQRGGAERVVATWHAAWPDAPLFTTLFDSDATYPTFRRDALRVSPLNHLAYLRHHHRYALPLLAPTVSATRIDADVTVASSSGWAHGYSTDGALVVYCHAPARWLYQTDRYFGRGDAPRGARIAQRLLFGRLRRWDQRAARRADIYVANSTFTRDLIREVYGRDATVIAPPVDLRVAPRRTTPISDVVVVARALPYKNLDLVLDVAALTPDVTYRIVGDGPLRASLTARSTNNVTWTGSLDDAALADAYATSSLHLALSHEDFGITPLEAAASGIPTVARRSGGYLDTITPRTGVLIDEDALSPAVIATTVRAALQRSWDAASLRAHAAEFSAEHHIAALQSVIDSLSK